jgi:hypothetical protein
MVQDNKDMQTQFSLKSEIEIIQAGEKEFKIGLNRTELIHGNIIYVIAMGPQTSQTAQAQFEVNKVLLQQVHGPINYLIDLNDCGKSSPEARKVWKELSEDEKAYKVALFGMHPVAKVLASFVMNLTLNHKMQFFKTKEEGLKWIRK